MITSNVTLDFETRSEADLKAVGAYIYSIDPTTEALCVSWDGPDAKGLWMRGESAPRDLFRLIQSVDIVEAHNVAFDRYIWKNVCVARLGWPDIPDEKWSCIAARAAHVSLPRKLEQLAPLFGLEKDKEGHKLMMKTCKPCGNVRYLACRALPPDPEIGGKHWHESPEEMKRLGEYCMEDSRVERELSSQLPPLTYKENVIWRVDQAVNRRGYFVDVPGIQKALDNIGELQADRNATLMGITGAKATQRAKLLAWLQSRHVPVIDTTAESIEEAITSRRYAPDVETVLQLMQEMGKSSLAKYVSFLDYAGPDGRVRDTLLYAGANRTGRWSGRGPQPQNLPRVSKGFDMEKFWARIHAGEKVTLQELSEGLRGAICAPPGKYLYIGDYNAIEARGLLWLANDAKGLNLLRSGDIYLDMASRIFGRPCTKADAFERQVGKVAILGLGYGMGAIKFHEFALSQGAEIEFEFAQDVVQMYRTTYPTVCQEWRIQEAAAIGAVNNPGVALKAGRIIWEYVAPWLTARLPSGRKLYYYQPRMMQSDKGPKLTYMGENSYTHKWERIPTWGGKLVENIVQALCRDLLAYALVRLERSELFTPVLTVHDEVLAEADRPDMVQLYEDIMSKPPDWAVGFPVKTEAKCQTRYSK